MLSSVMTGSLRIPTKSEFLALRPQRYSAFALAHDDPGRPLPDEAAEDRWWDDQVVSRRHQVAVLDHEEFGVCAVVHAFSFADEGRTCEVGFSLLSAEFGRRGLGSLALELWLEHLSAAGVRVVTSETSQLNLPAKAVLAKQGFLSVESYVDGPIEWEVWERELPADYSSASPCSQ